MKSLCVFLGSNISIKPEYFKHARELAAGLVKNNIRLVYGGGNNGLMGAIANTVIELGGQVIGVITEELYDKEGHCELTELVVVKSMHQRKQLLAQHANGFIAMPGGFGTLEEIFEIINGAKLKLHSKPIYLFNINGYFNHLLAFLDQATQEKFLHIQYNDLFKVFDNYAQILDDFMR